MAIYTRNASCCPIRAEEGITGLLCPPNSSISYRNLRPEQRIGGYPASNRSDGSLDEATIDSEGRCVMLEFPCFVLIGTYSPASRDESRDEFRLRYLEALDVRVRNLVSMGKSVLLVGDLNIVRSEMDYAGAADMMRKEGITVEDLVSTPCRRIFNQLIFDGRVMGDRDEGREKPVLWDLTRLHHPNRQGMYTCWETKKNARPGNFGSRIDYILCSDRIKDWFSFSNIQEGLMGSDHCPVYATIKDKVASEGKEVDIKDLMNPTGMFVNGERKREQESKHLLPLSGKLIPEFDRRRNIKDMLFKKAKASPRGSTNTGPAAPKKSMCLSAAVPPQPEAETIKAQLDGKGLSLCQTCHHDSSSTWAQATTLPKRPAKSQSPNSRPWKKAKPASVGKPKSGKATIGSGQATLGTFFRPTSAHTSQDETRAKSAEDVKQDAVVDPSALALEEQRSSKPSW